jgi:hypothetical protein
MPRKKIQNNRATPRRGNKYSKNTQPFFVGDLVDLDHSYHHHSFQNKIGVVLAVEKREGEWFVKIQFQDGTEMITYFGYVHLLVAAFD